MWKISSIYKIIFIITWKNVKIIFKSYISDLERYKWYFIGFLEDVCRSCKGYVDSYITVLDVEGFGFSNFDL